jgi:putative SOS response-associated peptidase YedK
LRERHTSWNYTRIENKATFSIFTQEVSPLFVRIHNNKNRQPVIFDEKQVSEWLKDELDESQIQTLLQTHYDENQLKHYPVSSYLFSLKVNSDVEEIMEKVDYESLDDY